MSAARPNPGLHPPAGYRYYDRSAKREFSGSSWADVARKVENYRRANGLKAGKPLEECHRAFCLEFPQYCSGVVKRVSVAVSPAAIGARVAVWISRFFSSKMEAPVDTQTAENRAAICAKCPEQVDWKASCGCNTEAFQSIKRAWLRPSKQKPTGKTEGTKACSKLGEETSFSVWAEQPPRDLGQPRNCWRLT